MLLPMIETSKLIALQALLALLAAPAKFEAELFTGKPTSGPYCGAIR